jgi:hypothetical protein
VNELGGGKIRSGEAHMRANGNFEKSLLKLANSGLNEKLQDLT